MVLKATVDYAPEIKKTKEQHKIGLESVAASLFVEMLVEFDKSDGGNPNNNLTMRRARKRLYRLDRSMDDFLDGGFTFSFSSWSER